MHVQPHVSLGAVYQPLLCLHTTCSPCRQEGEEEEEEEKGYDYKLWPANKHDCSWQSHGRACGYRVTVVPVCFALIVLDRVLLQLFDSHMLDAVWVCRKQ